MPLPQPTPEPPRPRAQHHPRPDPQTVDLMMTFPEMFPGSAFVAELEAEEEEAAEADWRVEQYVAANYGDGGVSKHVGLDEPDDWGDRSPLSWF